MMIYRHPVRRDLVVDLRPEDGPEIYGVCGLHDRATIVHYAAEGEDDDDWTTLPRFVCDECSASLTVADERAIYARIVSQLDSDE